MVLGGRKRIFTKKAQAAAAAAVLVAIIGALLVAYVILVSPEERAAILDGEIDSDDGSDSYNELLLEEFPGKIEYLSVDEVEHSLASVHVYTETNAETLTERSSLFAKRSVFSSNDASVSFALNNVDLVDDVLLSFRVVDSSGSLTLSFNGENLLEQEFNSEESLTVELPTELLQENNELIFRASSPGAAFWTSHEIAIENLMVVGDVTDNSHREATSVFSISDTEYENMESAVFSFQPDCASGTSGSLTITLNSAYTLYSASPDCSVQMGDIELDSSMLFVGQNTLHFVTDTGDYVLYNLGVESDLIEVEYPTYYFQLTYEEDQDVTNDDSNVEVTLEFADEGETKSGYISINGYKRHFDTTSSSYSFDISDYVTSGNNAISIQPSKTLEVRELLVELN